MAMTKLELKGKALKKYQDLKAQAELFDMEVDWETLELRPKIVKVKKWEYAEQDNWAGSPEQAWA